MPFLYMVLFLLGILIAYLVVSLMAGRPLFGPRNGERGGREKTSGGFAREGGKAPGRPKNCPICGSLLSRGERVKSFVFKGGTRSGEITERMSHIFGCPFCYPANSARPRICPVCKGTIPPDGYLIARMFERPDRPRKHVHVLGCTGCRKRKP